MALKLPSTWKPAPIMDDCCQDKSSELDALRAHQSRTLWIVLGINVAMFGVDLSVGLLSGSTALMADSLDMLGDGLVYGFSLYVVARSARWRAGAALMKGAIMALFGLLVLGQAGYHFIAGGVPDSGLMGAIGMLALAANLTCLLLLTRHRSDDLNMSSTWICSRNDIIANGGVLVAALAVFLTNSLWPDLVVGLLITAVFLRSAVYVIRQSVAELSLPKNNYIPPFSGSRRVITLVETCDCTVEGCRCCFTG